MGKIGNLELLTKVDLEVSDYVKFETELLKNSILVDEILYNKMSELQKEFLPILNKNEVIPLQIDDSIRLRYWWPGTRNPESLWENYLQKDDLIGQKDLQFLSLPSGIPSEKIFRKFAIAALELHPNIQEVISFIRISDRRFGEMRQHLKVIDPDLPDSTIAWQTLFRWFLYLDPERFEYFRPNFTEIIRYRD
jgi:hypothetical protein